MDRDHGAASAYFTVASFVAGLDPDVSSAVLRPAFEVARRGADVRDLEAEYRAAAASNAAWLGTRIADAMRRESAPPAARLAFLERVPSPPGDLNGLWAAVQRFDCLLELGRPGNIAAELDAIRLDAFEDPRAVVAQLLIRACRAELDLYVGNHDEALRLLLPVVRDETQLKIAGQVDPVAVFRLHSTYINYLFAAARFDEVGDAVAAARGSGTAVTGSGDGEFLDLHGAAATLIGSSADAAERAAALAILDRLGAESRFDETRCWAAIHRMRAALRAPDFEAAAAALARARATVTAGLEGPRRYLETGDAALLLRRHREEPVEPGELAAAAQRLEALWIELTAEVTQLPQRAGGVGFLHYAFRRDVLAQRLALRLALDPSASGVEGALESLLDAREALHPGAGTARNGGSSAPDVTLRAVRDQALVSDRHGVLIYLLGGGSSHVFAVDRDEVVHAELRGTDALHEMARRVAAAIGRGLDLARAKGPEAALEQQRRSVSRDIEDAAAAAAAAVLPESIRAVMADWDRLSVMGSELLPQLPFECLPFDEDLLGERFAVDHWPGAAFALARAAATPSSNGAGAGPPRLALFGAVRRPGDRNGLESGHVAPWLADFDEPIVRLEQHCRLGELTELAAMDVLVLLAHGRRRPDLVRPLVLEFADGELACTDVARLPAPRCAVLAACNSALGPNRFGAPLRADLGGAFLEHGAQCVVASPFALRLAPTMRILGVALPLLAKGIDPADALQHARCELAEAKDAEGALDRWTSAPLAVFGYGHRALR